MSPLHTVFPHFPNFELGQKSCLRLLAKLCGAAIILLLDKTVKKPLYPAAVSAASGVAAKTKVHTFLAATSGLRRIRRIKWY
jgi:hypothetical protein